MKIDKLKISFLSLLLLSVIVEGQEYKFNFTDSDKKGFVKVTSQTVFGQNSNYGFDLGTRKDGNKPYIFSVNLPEGNYQVAVVLGDSNQATSTTIKSESRRLMLENITTASGKFVRKAFNVNIRNKIITLGNDTVKTKSREQNKLNWDNKLTLEINGENPGIVSVAIKPVNVPTVFLAGNSTVVDQDNEPWCGWGQILPRFLNKKIVVANYAESGEASNTFVSSKRFAKLLSKLKKGDYVFIEFGHNDKKQKGSAFTTFKTNMKFLVDKTREKGGVPILVTPMHRRGFDDNGKVINTHGDYPDAVRALAKEEKVYLVDLNNMSQILYEAWGDEDSKKAFVHYPVGTFPGQDKPLADNTHFNTYGGYEICKCILKGLVDGNSPLRKYIVKDFKGFDPTQPDRLEDVKISLTPFSSTEKPDGN
ncbi:MAG: rhamnogalacturonan acetylesterase [Paludibacteraceae bacterium]